MPNYNDRTDRNNRDDRNDPSDQRQNRTTRRSTIVNDVPSNPAPRNFREDLEDLVTNATSFIDDSTLQLQNLNDVYEKFDEFLIDSLSSKFRMSEADARALGGMEDRIKYLEKNSYKLKVPEFAPIMDAAKELKLEMNKKEDDIRAEINKILDNQEKVIAANDERLKNYHQELMEDRKKAEDLEIENAGLLDTIPDITTLPLYDEVTNLKETIERKYTAIDDLRKKVEIKENDNIGLNNEIDELDDKIRNELAEVEKLNRDKIELEKEIVNLNKDLANLKKNGTPEEIRDLEDRIKERKDRKDRIINEVNTKKNTINSYREDKSKKTAKKNENIKTINTLNNEKKDLRSSLELNEKEHRFKLAELTKEREEDSEEVRKYKSNLKEIEKLNISNRELKYKDKKAENLSFKRKLDKNRRDINDKFREYKIEPPSNVAPNRNSVADEGNNDAPAQDGAGAQAKSGAAAPATSASAATGLVPADQFQNLSDKDLANNFYNDIVNKHYSPLEMQLKLSGYGFSTFVNACEHLSPKQRKNILPVLKERRVRLDSTQADQDAFDRVFGRGIYQLVFDPNTRKPKNLKDLSEDQIRELSIAAENFNKNLVEFEDDDIKVIESKFFDVLANSAVVDMYESSSTLKGRFKGWLDGFRNRQRVQVVKELRGTMCQYHKDKVDRFATIDARERQFKEILGRETVRNPVPKQKNANVPELTNSHSALRQEANDRVK